MDNVISPDKLRLIERARLVNKEANMRKWFMLGLFIMTVMLLIFSTGCGGDNPMVAGRPVIFVPEQLRDDMPLKTSLVWFGNDFRLDLLQWQGLL